MPRLGPSMTSTPALCSRRLAHMRPSPEGKERSGPRYAVLMLPALPLGWSAPLGDWASPPPRPAPSDSALTPPIEPLEDQQGIGG